MSENEKKFDLQDRLIDYVVRIIKVYEQLPETKDGKHISSQILRSGTSPAPNFIHKVFLAISLFFSCQFESFRGLKKVSVFPD